MYSLPHADEPDRIGTGDLLLSDPLTVVLNLHEKNIAFHSHGQADSSRFRMPVNVGQCFLEYAEQCRGEAAIKCSAIKTASNFANNPRSLLEFLRLPFDRRHETEVIQV